VRGEQQANNGRVRDMTDGTGTDSATGDSMANKRILVVEDNKDNMTLIVDVLTSFDHEVIQAFDGETGLSLARSEVPDLILMDLSLPRMDGWTAARSIKEDAALNQIPIIALTAHAMVGDKERALQAGCDDYLSKPIDLGEFARKLTHYLEQKPKG
jgi:CheY-like chemotaxis protein